MVGRLEGPVNCVVGNFKKERLRRALAIADRN